MANKLACLDKQAMFCPLWSLIALCAKHSHPPAAAAASASNSHSCLLLLLRPHAASASNSHSCLLLLLPLLPLQVTREHLMAAFGMSADPRRVVRVQDRYEVFKQGLAASLVL